MKRLFSFLVLLCLTCAAHAADDWYLTFSFDEEKKQAYVVATSSTKLDITIPETTKMGGEEYTITEIRNGAFKNRINLRSISLPKSLTLIGERAFSGCNNLKTVIHRGPVPPTIAADTYDEGVLEHCYAPQESLEEYRQCYKSWLDPSSFRDYSKLIVSKDDFYYYILDREDHKVSLLFSTRGLPSDFLVPNSTTFDDEDYYVTEIDDRAFLQMSGIESVTIPNTVTSIGAKAFYGSTLKSVSIPSSVSHIGESAFYGCSSLTSVMLPKSLTEISDCLFQKCTNLESVLIPSSVTSIGSGAFNNCSKLTNINIPNSVTSIKDGVFSYCISLKTIEIPNSVTTLDGSLFAYCTSLTSVSIPNSVSTIGGGVFVGCTSLASITIPKSVTNIASTAFLGCTNLKSITNYATSPQEIDDRDQIFKDISPSAELLVPEQSYYDYYNAAGWLNFRGRIKGISYDTHVGDLYYMLNEKARYATVVGCNPDVSDVVIPQYIVVSGEEYLVNGIDSYAFQDMSNLTSVTIGPSVTRIPAESFMNCYNLTSVTLPESLIEIGNSAFSNCWSLTSVTIPNSVTQIGSYAFAGCSSLTRVVNYATTPQTIVWSTFGDTDGKTLVIYKKSQYDYEHADYWKDFLGHIETMGTESVTLDGICYNLDPDHRTAEVTSGGDYSGHIDIPASITYEGFDYEVTSIGSSAFYNSGLTSITIPNTVTLIDYGAFTRCSALTELDLPNSVTRIDQAFFKCNNLTTVVIPSSVTDIAESAFNVCPMLTTLVNLSPTPQTFAEEFLNVEKSQITLYVPEQSVSAYKVHPYWREFAAILPLTVKACVDGIYYLTDPASRTASVTWGAERYSSSVNIPSTVTIDGIAYTVTSIGSEAFRNHSEITKVVIPNTVTTIGNNAFDLCTGLTSLTLPASITSIGIQAFMDCVGLTSINSLATVPPVLGFNAFVGIEATHIPVYVPQASFFSYYMADGWGDFFTNIQPTFGKGDINGDGRLSVIDITLLINYYLQLGGSKDIDPRYDVDGDGSISAADINELANSVLMK